MVERISEAEQAVLEILWDEAPLTATTVAERTRSDRTWSVQTVKTLLSRLVAKQAVDYELDGRRFLYRPIVERGVLATVESRRLLDRLFDGRAAPMVAHLAEQGELTPADIAEIEALLKALKS